MKRGYGQFCPVAKAAEVLARNAGHHWWCGNCSKAARVSTTSIEAFR